MALQPHKEVACDSVRERLRSRGRRVEERPHVAFDFPRRKAIVGEETAQRGEEAAPSGEEQLHVHVGDMSSVWEGS